MQPFLVGIWFGIEDQLVHGCFSYSYGFNRYSNLEMPSALVSSECPFSSDIGACLDIEQREKRRRIVDESSDIRVLGNGEEMEADGEDGYG